jgi:Leucine-rich repeat (LRR) protein
MAIMNFIGCEFLRKIPDVSWIPNLEELDLRDCKNLVEVHHSVGFHDKLASLKLGRCYNLRSFPRSLKMRSLKFLSLEDCQRLKNFPEIECQMECLEHINFSGTGIEELPLSIRHLVGVKTFYLDNCTNLMTHPVSVHKLKHLEIQPFCLNSKCLSLSGSNLFRTFGCCSTLTTLDLSTSDIVTIPPYIRQFVVLESLYLDECKQLREILGIPPNLVRMQAKRCVSLTIFLEEANTLEALFQVGTINPALILGNHVLTESKFLIQRDCPSSLTELNLSGSAIVSLPTWLNTFVGLEDLHLQGCNQLEEIPELPPNIEIVRADGCTSLKRFQFNTMKVLPKFCWIDFSNCHGLRENMGDDLQIGLLSEVSLFHLYILVICTSYH